MIQFAGSASLGEEIARLSAHIEAATGRLLALDVGRRSRSVPAPIRRALDVRDGTCRFPGCRNRFYERHRL